MSVAEFRELRSSQSTSKYRNKRVMIDGFSFDSKLEAQRYEELKVLRRSGVVSWFICQAPFRLPGGITYRADFLIVWKDAISFRNFGGDFVTIEDCKGAMTRLSITKIKQVEELYGLKVTLIKRAGKRR